MPFPAPLARAQLDADFGLSKEQLEHLTERVVFYVTSGTKSLQRLFLVYDMVESIKVSGAEVPPWSRTSVQQLWHREVSLGSEGP